MNDLEEDVFLHNDHDVWMLWSKICTRIVEISASPEDLYYKTYLDQKKCVLEAACSVIECRSSERSLDAFIEAIEKNPGYDYPLEEGTELLTGELVNELIKQKPILDLKLQERAYQTTRQQNFLSTEEGVGRKNVVAALQKFSVFSAPIPSQVVENEERLKEVASMRGN